MRTGKRDESGKEDLCQGQVRELHAKQIPFQAYYEIIDSILIFCSVQFFSIIQTLFVSYLDVNMILKTRILIADLFQKIIQSIYIITMRIRDRSTVYLYSISICMGSFVFGYELTSYGNLSHILSQGNEFQNEENFVEINTLLTSLLAIAAIFGVCVYRCVTSSFGFLNTFRYIDYLTIFAAFLGATSLSVSTQILSRILLGLVVGLNTITIPVYLTSCLPGSMGGPAGTLNQLFITIGILFGYLMGLTVVDSSPEGFSWRFLIALPIFPALIRIFTTKNVFPYETVEMMIETQDDEMLQKYIHHIWEEVTLAEFKESKKLPEEEIIAENAPYMEEIGEPFKRRFNMASLIIFFNQFSGSSTTFAFASFVFPQVVGWQAEKVLNSYVYLAFVQVVVTFLAGQFLEKYGRRSFMLEGQRIIIVSLVFLGLVEWAAPDLKGIEYLLIFFHMVGFSLSFGPCSFLVGTEIMHDITYPSIFFWVFIFIFGILNKLILQAYGPAKVFFFLAAVSLLGLFYIGFYLVETQGKSRQQVYKQFRSQCFPLAFKWKKFLTKRKTAQNDEESRSRELLNASLMEQRGSV